VTETPQISPRGVNYKALAISLLSAALFGYLIALYFQPIETEIEFNGPTRRMGVSEKDGSHTINYITTGPTFSSFNKGCPPVGTLDLGPFYNCLVMKYDGSPGIVQINIPSNFLEFDWFERVTDPLRRQVPFQRIAQDPFYTILRIQLPDNSNEISLVGGSNSPPEERFLITAFAMGTGVFFLTLFFIFEVPNFITNRLRNFKYGS
jgi:hypothetical protein